jgi:DnaJ-class molecular chaperone
MPRDYYDILGVRRDATDDEIRSAYRGLARRYHPDVNKDKDAEQRFAEVSEAYEVLSDPEKKAAYDRFGHAGVGAGGPSGGGPQGWGHAGGASAADFGDIFEQMFGGAGPSFHPGAGAAPPRPRPRRGHDLERTVTVTFMTAALGGTEHLRVAHQEGDQGGSGAEIAVTIPAGVEDGTKLRLRGRGSAGSSGGPRGDLIVTVRVGRHPYFRREGLDVLIDLPISVTEATLGCVIDVPLLAGSVELRVPPGSSSGTRLRVKDKGIRPPKRAPGNFYAVVQIAAPSELSPRARGLFESLREELKNPRDSRPWADP